MKFAALLCLGLLGAVIAVGASKESVTHVNPPACREHVVLNESDNGSSVCVAAHSDVTIMLKTAAGSSWSTPTATGHVLGPALGLPTPFGYIGWSFRTNAAGHTAITTHGQSCSAPAQCHDVDYRVGVTVGVRSAGS